MGVFDQNFRLERSEKKKIKWEVNSRSLTKTKNAKITRAQERKRLNLCCLGKNSLSFK
jgi:hypothetical protein